MNLNDIVTIELPVRPNDFDRSGHVNNAVVVEYFESGRWAWLARHDLLDNSEVIAVVSRLELDYRRQIRSSRILVRTQMVEPRELDMEEEITFRAAFHQEIAILGEEGVAAVAKVSIAFVRVCDMGLATLQEFREASTGQERPGDETVVRASA